MPSVLISESLNYSVVFILLEKEKRLFSSMYTEVIFICV